MYSASSPSYVLQSQPFFENFCSTPARSPSEYAHDNENQVHSPGQQQDEHEHPDHDAPERTAYPA